MRVSVKGISVIGPGLNGWRHASSVLSGEQAWRHEPVEKLKPALLPPNERRRTTQLIKLALQSAEEAQLQSGMGSDDLACVFASSDGDTFIVDRLCDALTLPERPVSPTQFHNSVHNAAAGYWAIAAKAQRFSTSISAGAASFAAGLLEAMSYVVAEDEAVLLVCYDVALPEPLDCFGINHETFATALVLVPEGEGGTATLSLMGEDVAGRRGRLPTGLEELRAQNPAAEALPLLQVLAMGGVDTVSLAYLDGGSIAVEVAGS
ncbi:MAG: beta-ketoacyl synthase chain length factor [Pseudomonadota bacterium]